MQKYKAFLGLTLALLLLAACGPETASPVAAPTTGANAEGPPPTPIPASPTPERPLAALVNGQPIYLVDYERQVARYEAARVSHGEIDLSTEEGQARLLELRRDVLNGMIEQVLIEQAAAQQGITVSDAEVDAALNQMIAEIGEEAFQQQLEENGLTMEEVREGQRATMIYQKVFEWVTSSVPERAEQVHARHILVDTQEEAEQLLAQLQAGADFAELARKYSRDETTREAGGDLGWFPRGVLLSTEVEEAAFSLNPGQISPVIHSPLGYHIVQVLERDPDRPLNPETLHQIKSQVFQEWLESLWAEAHIERFVDVSP